MGRLVAVVSGDELPCSVFLQVGSRDRRHHLSGRWHFRHSHTWGSLALLREILRDFTALTMAEKPGRGSGSFIHIFLRLHHRTFGSWRCCRVWVPKRPECPALQSEAPSLVRPAGSSTGPRLWPPRRIAARCVQPSQLLWVLCSLSPHFSLGLSHIYEYMWHLNYTYIYVT